MYRFVPPNFAQHSMNICFWLGFYHYLQHLTGYCTIMDYVIRVMKKNVIEDSSGFSCRGSVSDLYFKMHEIIEIPRDFIEDLLDQNVWHNNPAGKSHDGSYLLIRPDRDCCIFV